MLDITVFFLEISKTVLKNKCFQSAQEVVLKQHTVVLDYWYPLGYQTLVIFSIVHLEKNVKYYGFFLEIAKTVLKNSSFQSGQGVVLKQPYGYTRLLIPIRL